MEIYTLQWNIGGGRVRERDSDPRDPNSYSKENLRYIETMLWLASGKVDIVTLQEAHYLSPTQSQARTLAQNLGFNFVQFPISPSHMDPEQSLALAILSKFPISHETPFLLDNPGYQKEKPDGQIMKAHDKGILRVTAHLEDFPSLDIMTAHLFPFHAFDVDPLTQTNLFTKVREALTPRVNLALIQGDFNVDGVTISDKLPVVPDSFTEVAIKKPTLVPENLTVDHIFYRGLTHLASEVVDGIMTDHKPILSRFEL